MTFDRANNRIAADYTCNGGCLTTPALRTR